jgi:DNA-binding YbaB/EbfC family protein
MADFLGMMKQAAQLQSKMQAMQEELDHVEVEGMSGGGLVTVRMTAKMEVKAVKIDPSLMKADEREILEDLLVTAHNDARRKAEAAMQEKMQALTGGLQLPPGLGLGCAIRRSSWWSPTSPICGRWNALMPQMDFTTCSAPRCRRSMASGRRT